MPQPKRKATYFTSLCVALRHEKSVHRQIGNVMRLQRMMFQKEILSEAQIIFSHP
jgi:hypothetical protein